MDLGAADYIVKPFSPTELTARVRAALRRRAETEPFVLDDLVIHYEQRRVQVAGRPVQLTATEFDLLRVLSVNAGRVLTNEALLRQVWGGRDAGDACVRDQRSESRRRRTVSEGRAWTRLGSSSCVSSSSTTSPRGPQITMRSISSSVIVSAVRS